MSVKGVTRGGKEEGREAAGGCRREVGCGCRGVERLRETVQGWSGVE